MFCNQFQRLSYSMITDDRISVIHENIEVINWYGCPQGIFQGGKGQIFLVGKSLTFVYKTKLLNTQKN